jgi:hypothetical protein
VAASRPDRPERGARDGEASSPFGGSRREVDAREQRRPGGACLRRQRCAAPRRSGSGRARRRPAAAEAP